VIKSSTSMKRGLAYVKREWRARRYDRALAGVDRLLKDWPDNPYLLTMRGNLIQLQEKDTGPTLDDAKRALRRAVDLDGESPQALIELGHFLNATEDDVQAASDCFAKAIRLSERLLREALLGQAKVLVELGRRSEALACLTEAYWLQSRNGKAGGPGDQEIFEQLEALSSLGGVKR
jgi:tetratricopeptide (TPR) repeat protein